ncbi:MAG TPA: FAD-binding oxidoreductase [Ktedonobacterales bacterium]|nr:FAD-binding oxidoreductase [Ktedonobacterales bacterium]
MRRWNGWGDETISQHLPGSAARFLEQLLGKGKQPHDVTLAEVVQRVPATRLPEHPLVTTDAAERVRHARGQSLPDWIALRSGQVGVFPDGVAYPQHADDAAALIAWAQTVGAQVIPYGGGTSVVGHINPEACEKPVLTVDMSHMNRLRAFDEVSQLASFEAGVRGPDLEAHLRARGYTLGHFPQSFEYSTLGGWIATRSSGSQSLGYGRIEQRFAGGKMVSPVGIFDLPAFPASAAGPDLCALVLGSEGRLGIITEATMRVSPLPEVEAFHGIFFPSWEQGVSAARELLQSGLPLSLVRLSTPRETETNLMLAGHRGVIVALDRYLAFRGAGAEKCMMILGFAGHDALVEAVRKRAFALIGRYQGVHLGQALGRQWHRSRFRTPYLRNTLWEAGYAIDTLETATMWNSVPEMVTAIEVALCDGLAEQGERVHVFTHLSHLYRHGASIYTTYLYRLAASADDTLARWQRLKTAASEAIVAHGGTISHQHGVGRDHLPYLSAEKGAAGIAAIQAICAHFDPAGIMNPGKLVSKRIAGGGE